MIFLKVYLLGAGMGNTMTLTSEAEKVIESADIIIGSERITDNINTDKEIYNSYNPSDICEYLKEKSFNIAAVLLSGDIGFYSGAKRLIDALKDYETELIPGISSVVYFCAKIKTAWEDVKLLSIHGKKKNIIGYIKRYKKVFILLSGNNDIKSLVGKLCYYGLGDVIINIGERLSYKNEKITRARASDIKNFDFEPLAVVLIENEEAYDRSNGYIDDCEFIRGNVPMTKSEVRTISIAKLALSQNSVLYDVGAGTGSVSVESALKIIDGEVYAVEKNKEAVRLIEENKRKFAADNITVIEGNAPEVLENLPVPTHIFIGGSSGNIENIVKLAFEKNADVKIVINAVSLDTVTEIMGIIKRNGYEYDIVCANIAKNRNIGGYTLMTGQNPVYIFIVNRLPRKL